MKDASQGTIVKRIPKALEPVVSLLIQRYKAQLEERVAAATQEVAQALKDEVLADKVRAS